MQLVKEKSPLSHTNISKLSFRLVELIKGSNNSSHIRNLNLMDQQHKGQLSHLLEHTWFFGNTLLNKSRVPKTMVRSNSDPCPFSTPTKVDDTLNSPDSDSIRMNNNNNNNLCRAPSLPISLGKDKKYELVEEEEEEDEPRMGDLIRQAMPMPVATRRLDRMSSLPPCRVVNNEATSNVEKGEKLCRKVSVESPALLLHEKGPIAMTKLTRTASMDSSLFLPPKCNSKGTKQNPSNSKNKTPRKREPTKMNNPTKIDHSNIQTIDPDNKIKSQKSLSALQTEEELQAFKDLGFSIDNKDLNTNVTTQIRPGRLQRKASLDSKVMRPYFSDNPPSVPDWVDPKATSSQDMKAQIKFWARAVASNVHQEC